MKNIYDSIGELYEQDPDWNEVVDKAWAEGFIRELAWSGKSEKEMHQIWDDLTFFIVYLGNSENYLGNMNRENFVDCVAWIARNIGGRPADYETVSLFLQNVESFYKYLGKKKIVRNQQAVSDARMRILADNKVNFMDEEGNINPLYAKSNIYPTADLPHKVFLEVGDILDEIHKKLGRFLIDKDYRPDFLRSEYLFSGFLDEEVWGDIMAMRPNADFLHLNYYLYDYHMLADDRHPIEAYYEGAKAGKYGKFSKTALEFLKLMTKTRLIIFSVEEKDVDDGFYIIKNFLTEATYSVLLPVDETAKMKDFKDVLFYGHLIYDETMTTQIIQGTRFTKRQRENLRKVIQKAKGWFEAQESAECTIEEFLDRNGLLIHHFFDFFDKINAHTLDKLTWFTNIVKEKHLHINVIREDEVTKYMDEHLPYNKFSLRDVHLLKRIWTDFRITSRVRVTNPQLWTLAVLWNFRGINDMQITGEKDIENLFDKLEAKDVKKVKEYSRKIYETSRLTSLDVRYLNEEGVLKSFLVEFLE
ncbi:MAG: hypothetical protein Q4D21_05410 [Phascolarctobacterium sp.]|nr:hypothetical protein [Phascolarctobacterium sp.]